MPTYEGKYPVFKFDFSVAKTGDSIVAKTFSPVDISGLNTPENPITLVELGIAYNGRRVFLFTSDENRNASDGEITIDCHDSFTVPKQVVTLQPRDNYYYDLTITLQDGTVKSPLSGQWKFASNINAMVGC